jgi:hypothetical protein
LAQQQEVQQKSGDNARELVALPGIEPTTPIVEIFSLRSSSNSGQTVRCEVDRKQSEFKRYRLVSTLVRIWMQELLP